MTPIDITKILTAAAPIAASLATIANRNMTENNNGKDSKPTTINVTINNNFYTKSEKEAYAAASAIQDQIVEHVSSSGGTRYII